MENTKAECRQVLARLYEYLDGELETEVYVEIQSHLARCLPCHERAEFERVLKVFVGSTCKEKKAPESLLRRIRNALDDA
jgi:mycothiol system anti-sigma-R factor